MNKTVPSAKNWPDKKKPRRLQVIDTDRSYNSTGRAIHHLRKIRAGEYGKCTDVLLIARCIDPVSKDTFEGGVRYVDFANGTATAETYGDMAEVLRRRYIR